MKYEDLPEPTEDRGPIPREFVLLEDRLKEERDRLKEELRITDKLLARIAVACTGALDPELTREQLVGRVKFIYSLAADDDGTEADFEEAADSAEGP